jgi:ribosome-binding factor A
MKGKSRRPEQVAETVRQVVADALVHEVRDPRVGFVTVTGVRVTNELSHATVAVSVMGEEPDKVRAIEGLKSAAGFLRGRLTRALSTRTVPELHFELDRGLEKAARINQLLSELKHEEPAADVDPAEPGEEDGA